MQSRTSPRSVGALVGAVRLSRSSCESDFSARSLLQATAGSVTCQHHSICVDPVIRQAGQRQEYHRHIAISPELILAIAIPKLLQRFRPGKCVPQLKQEYLPCWQIFPFPREYAASNIFCMSRYIWYQQTWRKPIIIRIASQIDRKSN